MLELFLLNIFGNLLARFLLFCIRVVISIGRAVSKGFSQLLKRA